MQQFTPEHEWTLDEYLEVMQEQLDDDMKDGNIPVRLDRLREVTDAAGLFPKAFVDVNWWKRVVDDAVRERKKDDEKES